MFASSRSRPPSAAESARSSAAGTTGTTRKPLDSRASQCSAVQAVQALDKDYAKPWVHTHKHKLTHTDMHKHTPIIGSSRLP